MMRKAIAALLLLLGTTDRALAQYPLVRTFTAMVGQQSLHATCLAQDHQGLIWLGSDRGLFRTDGDRTDPILRTEGDAVVALCGTDQGVLAALASGPVLRCDGRGCDTLWSDTLYRTTAIRSLVVDHAGAIWAGTYGSGIHLWRNGSITRITLADGLNDDHVNAQCAITDGRMAVATDQGIAITGPDGRVISTFGERQGAPDNLVLALNQGPDGRLWAGTDRGGAFSFDPGRPEKGARSIDSAWTGGAITRIIRTRDRTWMAVQDQGMVVCDLSDGLAYYVPVTSQQGAGAKVLDMLLDAQGAVWWCDGSTTLRRADPDVLITPGHEDVSMLDVTAIARGPGTMIAFATDRNIYIHANTFREAERLQRFPLPLDSTTRVVSLSMDGRDQLWAGTFGKGVFSIGHNGVPVPFDGAPDRLNDNVLSLRSKGDTMWYATLDGLYRSVTRADGLVSTLKVPMPGSGFTYDVQPLPDGAVIVATDGNGIIRVERDGSARVLPGAQPGHRTFYSLCADSAGNAWVCGPSAGLYRVERDRLVAIPLDAGALMNEVFALEYFNHRLFIFGDGGAYLVDPATGVTDELTGTLGLGGAQAEMNAVTTDAEGTLWAATNIGLFRLSPQLVPRRSGIRTVITSVSQGGDDLGLLPPVELQADDDHITFRFTGIHYDAPEEVRFAYRMTGIDTTLRTTLDRELTFSHLAPGNYRFEVFAFHGRQPTNAAPVTFAFSVAAPWWRRPWAVVTGLSLLALIGFSTIRIRDNRLRAQDRLEKVQAEMEREKVRFQMQVLRSQVNPHFLFNSFNTLIGLIEDEPDKAVRHVEQLSDFFREILQVRDKELIPLRDELRLVDTYFFLEQRRFGDRINLRTHATQAALEARVPPLTVQLLVENALKHNRATDEEPLVTTIDADAGQLTVTNPFRPRDTMAKSTGFGIDSIVQRFAAITPRPVSIGREGDNFVARIPLIPPGP